MKLNENTTIRDLYDNFDLRAMRGNYISSVNDLWIQSSMSYSLRQIHEQHSTWGLDDMLYGLRRLERASRAGHPLVFSVYEENEVVASPDKAQAQMLQTVQMVQLEQKAQQMLEQLEMTQFTLSQTT